MQLNCIKVVCLKTAHFQTDPKMTFSNGYNKLTVRYFELKLDKYILGTTETNITSCKKGHNRCPLSQSDPLLCILWMSPLFNTPDSDPQPIRIDIESFKIKIHLLDEKHAINIMSCFWAK